MATAYQWTGQGSGAGGEGFPVGGQSRVREAGKPRLVTQAGRETAGKANRGGKPPVVEFYTVKRIDNSRLVRHADPAKMRNLYKTVALGWIVAACCMLYVYQHFRCIDLSFQMEELKGKQELAQAANGKLKLEIATLRDPRRIDVIARHQLGLTQPAANQMREYGNPDGAEVAAVQFVRPNRAP